jgi:predicted DNA binding CopG/RHH family protein
MKKGSMKMKDKRLSFTVTGEMHLDIQKRMREKGMSLSQYVEYVVHKESATMVLGNYPIFNEDTFKINRNKEKYEGTGAKKWKQLSVGVLRDTYDTVKKASISTGIPMANLIRDMITSDILKSEKVDWFKVIVTEIAAMVNLDEEYDRSIVRIHRNSIKKDIEAAYANGELRDSEMTALTNIYGIACTRVGVRAIKPIVRKKA